MICINDILSNLYQLYFPIYILLILSILLSAFYNLPFHELIIAPIYYRGMGLICIPLSGVGLPGVNLIIYKDDLRMMA